MRPYFIVGLNLAGERALVIGGGAEAADKARQLVGAGALVSVVAPRLEPTLEALATRSLVHWCQRRFTPEDARGARVVVLAERDPDLARALRAQGRRDGFWLCAIDQPDHCDFVNVARVAAGPLQIGLSSGGTAPALLRALREGLEAAFDGRFVRFVERFGAMRKGPPGEGSEGRRERLARALEGFELEVGVRYPRWEGEPEAP